MGRGPSVPTGGVLGPAEGCVCVHLCAYVCLAHVGGVRWLQPGQRRVAKAIS